MKTQLRTIQHEVYTAYMFMFPQILTGESIEQGKLPTEKFGMTQMNSLDDTNSRVDSKQRSTLLIGILYLRCLIEVEKC